MDNQQNIPDFSTLPFGELLDVKLTEVHPSAMQAYIRALSAEASTCGRPSAASVVVSKEATPKNSRTTNAVKRQSAAKRIADLL